MKTLAAGDPETRSADVLAENVKHLKELFPEVFTEGKLDFEVLKQLLGGLTDEREEKYGLNWHGKRRARQLALTPSTGTLRPCPNDSVAWETTQNLMIEGENLEVLKLLQKSYAGRVKLIYIDPPYNTGKDFVYPDRFQSSIKNYLELTKQAQGGAPLSSNTKASGRFHTDWLTMLYPRLKLASTLLTNDGLIFISIDDNEVHSLRFLCDELFGEENFVAQIVWQKIHSTKNDAKYLSVSHEYILIYAKSIADIDISLLARTAAMNERFSNPDGDPRGEWASADLVANEERAQGSFEIQGPTGKTFNVPKGKHWLYARDTMERLIAEGRIWFGKGGDAFPRLKRYLGEIQQGRKADTLWMTKEVGSNQESKREVKSLFDGDECFNNPKPVRLIRRCLELGTRSDSLVLDFFAGSGTTGHAVLAQNAEDGGSRRYLLIQLPEPLDPNDKGQKAAADCCDRLGRPRNIAELTRERLRRASGTVKSERPMFEGDLGFRGFRLDSSNIEAWEPRPNDLDEALLESVKHVKADRTEADLLYELLLKRGLDLCVPIEMRAFNGKEVHSVGRGVLLACLAEQIGRDEVEALALSIVEWHRVLAPAGETICVFRDSAFADDVAKTNMAAILEQNGIVNMRNL